MINQSALTVQPNTRSGTAADHRRMAVEERMVFAARADVPKLFEKFSTSELGVHVNAVEDARERFGANVVTRGDRDSLAKRLVSAFINPFTGILIFLGVVSLFTDVILAEPGSGDFTKVVIIAVMFLISGLLRFVQEMRSGNAAENLLKMITTTALVSRRGADQPEREIDIEDIVVGDIVRLAAGDMVPADMRIFSAKDLFVSQSALTGESIAVEKIAGSIEPPYDTLTEVPDLAFMGTTVVSGSASGVVVATGDDTLFGSMSQAIEEPVQTGFEKGVNSVSWLLIRFMAIMVPVVFIINGVTKGDWVAALTFAISVGVGLTPEMLPTIITVCLAKGATSMSKKKVIMKNLNSIQNLGSMDVLCTDKTGTLTQDKVVLEYHLDVDGEKSDRVLRHAYLNSHFQTGLRNLMDSAIISSLEEAQADGTISMGLAEHVLKVDEIPFDFERRRMSVVVADRHGATQIITKGAVEEMISICDFVERDGHAVELTDEIKRSVLKKADELNEDGMRVVVVARKDVSNDTADFGVRDERGMTLLGYLAFLDPPKPSAATAIETLNRHGVDVKILTGDNDKVTRTICRQVNIPVKRIVLGSEVEAMSERKLASVVREHNVFAKLSPKQKSRVVSALRENGSNVGYMGDGINDAAAMQAADIGISVDTAVDVAKESADVILLEKDLTVLESGIIEGRKTYANMIKYIKMTASSNFGNVFSVLLASAFLPFEPMVGLQLILLNLIYDLSCTAIPWDNVDSDYLLVPRRWNASSIGRFMLWIGPTSSVFDITTYLLMYFVVCPALTGGRLFGDITDPALAATYIALFQSGWFIESMWTQTLVIHMIRTPRIPFIQSRAAAPLTLLTVVGISVLTAIPFTPFGAGIGLTSLPFIYFPGLIVTVMLYMGLAQIAKRHFIARYGELL
ncbi:magnesium-translocating P-type ATPase [Coriobacterium glomerans PW2]|uniref:Magnesium-transporting ATPase, P-type 1 n=1 Tax=Coriobacterium glomerans (strain ATCC 49209 / DSM 20642 / JCM 10262 / PW2) TaxID=700015 RepID=F2N784_CORGP|nr:magnesium-translocating P-type ATPase [Coriobacterium glomerans]AEB06559.1 magnesium-translocating P-type ATPase [Coriobacterium glomerans PW2]